MKSFSRRSRIPEHSMRSAICTILILGLVSFAPIASSDTMSESPLHKPTAYADEANGSLETENQTLDLSNRTNSNSTIEIDETFESSYEEAVRSGTVEVINPKESTSSDIGKPQGAMTRAGYNGWSQESGGWYFYQNGVRLKNCWMLDSEDWCWLGSDGRAFQYQWGWLYDSDGWNWYYFDSNARIVRESWRRDSAAWCYLDRAGHAMGPNKWANGYGPHGNFITCFFDRDYRARVSDAPGSAYI